MYDLIIATTVIVCLSIILAMYYFKTKQHITLSYAVQDAPSAPAQKQPAQKQPSQKQPAQKQPAQKQPAQKPFTQPPLKLQPGQNQRPSTQKIVKPPIQVAKPPTQKPVKRPSSIPVPKENVPIYNPPFGIGSKKPTTQELKKLIDQEFKKGGASSSNKKIDDLSKDIKKMTNKLNTNQQQYKELVAERVKIDKLLNTSGRPITVNGSTKNVWQDLQKIIKDDKNVDKKGFYNTVAKYFSNKGGNLSTSEYNSLLNGIINLGMASQNYRVPVDTKSKTKNDFRHDINQLLKQNGIPVSSSAGTAVRKYLSSVLNDYNIKNMPNNVYNALLGNQGQVLNNIVDKLDDKMVRAVKTLNAKNSSGQLPDNSNYKELVKSGLVYFNKDTGAWSMTQKGKQVNKALSVDNSQLTSNKVYNDVYKYLNQNKAASKLEDRVQQAIKTLNAKNSSGKLPSDSNYKDLVSNGLVYFNKNTGAWTVTQKGKNIPQYLTNSVYGNVSNFLDTLNNGNFNSNSYNFLLNNMINSQLNSYQYMIPPSEKTITQIQNDVTNTLAKYYNVDTSKINPIVTNMITDYMKQRDLNKLDSSEYRNLMNSVVKGYGLGNGTLTPTGQGLEGRITIDNQQVPNEKLQSDVISVMQQIYATRPDLADGQNILNNVMTYLNTKGGNVSSNTYDDLIVGLVRGYGIGNGTLSTQDLYPS